MRIHLRYDQFLTGVHSPGRAIVHHVGPDGVRPLLARQLETPRRLAHDPGVDHLQGCFEEIRALHKEWAELGEKDGEGPVHLQLLEDAARQLYLSPRACHRILKVARTVADLEQAAKIDLLKADAMFGEDSRVAARSLNELSPSNDDLVLSFDLTPHRARGVEDEK